MLNNLNEKASKSEKANRKFFLQQKKKKYKGLDDDIHELHDEVFEEIDCLDCANCCKSISPMVFDKDVERIAKHQKQKPSTVVEQYFIAEEDHYIFKQQPCPFLAPDNYCLIYEHRPKACREYPHTDRKNFYQLIDLTIKNSYYCPAVYEILERLKQ